MSDARRDILAALGTRTEAVGDPPHTPAPGPRRSPHELSRLLARRMQEHGVGVHLTQDHDASFQLLADQLFAAGVRSVVVAEEPLLEAIGLAERLARALSAVTVRRPGELHGDAAWEAMDAGITGATAFWAETGTMVLDATSRRALLTSLLPPWHLVLGEGERIHPDASDWERSLPPGEGHLPLVTLQGPSRTADIEKRLVLGVHGPRRVSAFIAVGKLLDFQDPTSDDPRGG
ncbi:MAG: LUD domain-containing protein [Deltaproteobacteria bacterium]|nr:LUD domain-containing protein [Deltaproteobacteria bacterium]